MLGGGTAGRKTWKVPAIAFAAAWFFSVGVAGSPFPPGFFPKYLSAIQAPAEEQAQRLLDYSPLYLALTRLLAPGGARAMLWLQCALHAFSSAALAAAVSRLAGLRWGLVAGLLAASYRPFLVYCGIHEPEIPILFCLALAVLFGGAARNRLEVAEGAGAGGLALAGASAGRMVAAGIAPAAAAGAALGAAALLRPHYLLLVPVWAIWVGAPAAPGRRWKAAGAVVAAAALCVTPVLVSRSHAAGTPTIMNPGPVFYEGNGPGASGLVRHAPVLVQALERAHPESIDYGHVAYRRVATAALGREAGVAEANRYWAGLALEGMREHPLASVRRCTRKLLMSLMPREGHDLIVAEHLDRRVRRLLPWGFGLLCAGLPWIFAARRERWSALAAPLAIAALSVLVQTLFYASARQRLPLALALMVIGPVLARDLLERRLRGSGSPLLWVGTGLAAAAAITLLCGRFAVIDELTWNRNWLPGVDPLERGVGASLARLHDGQAWRRGFEDDYRRFLTGVRLVERARPEEALGALQPLLGQRHDYTLDDRLTGVPELWAAMAHLQRRDRSAARVEVQRALATRPGDLLLQALAKRLGEDPPQEAQDATGAGWRPAGWDPLSARWALARAAAMTGDREASRRLVHSLSSSFPELLRPPAPR